MVDFIVNNYLIIMIIAAFLIFALIGFAVDTTKNKNNKESEILTEPNEEEATEVINESVNQDVTTEAPIEEPINPVNNDIPEAETINMNMDN